MLLKDNNPKSQLQARTRCLSCWNTFGEWKLRYRPFFIALFS